MNAIRRIFAIAIPLFLLTGSSGQEKSITLTSVKYDTLKQEILKHRGKVVIVDFWASTCVPCRKAMPKFVEMQKEHAAKGLVIVSVSMDTMGDKQAIDRAAKFLTDLNSPFRNYHLDEPTTVWKDKFGFNALPCYFVFDRHGKWVRFRGEDSDSGVNHDELKKVVVQMLNEK